MLDDKTLVAEVQAADDKTTELAAAGLESPPAEPAAKPSTVAELQAQLQQQATEAERLRKELSGRGRENERLKRQLQGLDLKPVMDRLGVLEQAQLGLARRLLRDPADEPQPRSQYEDFEQELARNRPRPQPGPERDDTENERVKTLGDALTDMCVEAGIDPGAPPPELVKSLRRVGGTFKGGEYEEATDMLREVLADYKAGLAKAQEEAAKRQKAAAHMAQAKVKPEAAAQDDDDDTFMRRFGEAEDGYSSPEAFKRAIEIRQRKQSMVTTGR